MLRWLSSLLVGVFLLSGCVSTIDTAEERMDICCKIFDPKTQLETEIDDYAEKSVQENITRFRNQNANSMVKLHTVAADGTSVLVDLNVNTTRMTVELKFNSKNKITTITRLK